MPHRHPALPTIWLMTDERMGDTLWQALERLPRGSGVVFRHYSLPLAARRALFARVRRVAARRQLVLIRAGRDRLGAREQGMHGRDPRRHPGINSWPAHSRAEICAGLRAGADLIFVSPVFATRSHPGGRTLGRRGALAIKQGIAARFIALGGLTRSDQRWVTSAGFYGWAAIDAWTRPLPDDQKRRAVPI